MFFSSLGLRFLRRFYRSIFADKSGFGIGVFQNGSLVGFAIGTLVVEGFYSRISVNNFVSLTIGTLSNILKSTLFIKLLTSLASNNKGISGACLLSICVLPVKESKGVGTALILEFERFLSLNEIKVYSLTTDASGNDSVNSFYLKNKFSLTSHFANIEARIKSEKITNVILKEEWVELKFVPYILTKSSLNLLNYAKNPIFRYGGSQSKSFQYMASGRPICSNIEMAYCPITKYNLGIAKNFKNAKAYSDAILEIYSLNKDKYNELCSNALMASKEYDYEYLTDKYINYCIND